MAKYSTQVNTTPYNYELNVLLVYIRLQTNSNIIQRHYYLPRNIIYSNRIWGLNKSLLLPLRIMIKRNKGTHIKTQVTSHLQIQYGHWFLIVVKVCRDDTQVTRLSKGVNMSRLSVGTEPIEKKEDKQVKELIQSRKIMELP